MLDLIEGIPFRVLYNEEDMVVAGDVFFLCEDPELVLPDEVVDGGKSRCINPFEDIAEPVPAGEDVHTSPGGKHPSGFSNPPLGKFPVLLFRDLLVPLKNIAAGPVVVQPLSFEIYGERRIRDNKIN